MDAVCLMFILTLDNNYAGRPAKQRTPFVFPVLFEGEAGGGGSRDSVPRACSTILQPVSLFFCVFLE